MAQIKANSTMAGDTLVSQNKIQTLKNKNIEDFTLISGTGDIYCNTLHGKIETSYVLHVAKNGDDNNAGTLGDPFLTIEAAMNSAVSNTKTSISVYPGVYYENTINVKRKVAVIGAEGPEVTYVCTNSGITTLFNFDSTHGRMLSRLENIGLYDYDEDNRATLINVSHHGTLTLRDLEFCGCKSCLVVNHSDAMVRMSNSNVDGDMSVPIEDVIKVNAGYVDISGLYNIYGSNITNLITCSGTASRITISSLTSRSPGSTSPIVENVFNISDGGKITCMDTILEECDNCICIDNVGTDSTFYGRSVQMNPKEKAIYNTSATANINLIAVDIEREQIDSVCDVKIVGWDSTSEKIRHLGNTGIGMDGSGNSLQIGEGGSYEYGVKTITYSGTTYTEISNGEDTSFPSTASGTAIYFGDSKNYYFYGLSYIMGNTPIDLGTGAIAWEYYDSTNGWQTFNTLNTITGYSNSTANTSFSGDEDVIYTIRFDQNIKTGIKENNTTNSGIIPTTISGIGEGMYVRCRITSDITISPVFKNIRLKGNYKSIRPNGTEAGQGEARAKKLITLPFGDSSTDAADKTLNISSNISYPFCKNSLRNVQSDALYFRFYITPEVDTSCGLTLNYLGSTGHTGTADKTAVIYIHTSLIQTDTDAYSGTNTEVIQNCNFEYIANEIANKIHNIEICNRIDINNLKTGDIVFAMIKRVTAEESNPVAASVDFSAVNMQYTMWQSGEYLL